jgi:hypothetical protein
MCTVSEKRDIPVSFKTSAESYAWLQAQRGTGKLQRTLSWVVDYLVDAARQSGKPLDAYISASGNWKAYADKLEAENAALRLALAASQEPPDPGTGPPHLNDKGAHGRP